MGDAADYDMCENINNIGKMDVYGFECGYCGKSYGRNKDECQRHVNECEEQQNG